MQARAATARRLRDIDRAATLRAYCLARLEEHLGPLRERKLECRKVGCARKRLDGTSYCVEHLIADRFGRHLAKLDTAPRLRVAQEAISLSWLAGLENVADEKQRRAEIAARVTGPGSGGAGACERSEGRASSTSEWEPSSIRSRASGGPARRDGRRAARAAGRGRVARPAYPWVAS